MLFDGVRGHVFGKSVNDSVFVAELEPGDYLMCAAPVFDDADHRMDQLESARRMGIVSPVSRLSVSAGKTYLVQISFDSDHARAALPVGAGSKREELAALDLPHLRQAELVPDTPDNAERSLFRDPKVLARWFEFCLDSSGDDMRLRLRAEDGR